MISKRLAVFVLILLSLPLLADELKSDDSVFNFNPKTGALLGIFDSTGKSRGIVDLPNSYLIQRKSGDVQLQEKDDKVTGTAHAGGQFVYQCANDQLPQLQITKRYWVVDGVLRREMTFRNLSSTLQKVTFEVLPHELQRNYKVFDSQPLAVLPRILYLPDIVL